MSQEEIIQHWRQGAHDALAAAHLLHKNGFYESALFHCHLASLIDHTLAKSDMKALQELSGFVVDARYSDPYWVEEEATVENSERWIIASDHILFLLLHEEHL